MSLATILMTYFAGKSWTAVWREVLHRAVVRLYARHGGVLGHARRYLYC